MKKILTISLFWTIILLAQGDALFWTTKAPAPSPTRCQIQAHGNVRDTIYICGGRTSGALAINRVEAYVPATNTWITTLPQMPQSRSHGCGDVIDTVIYAVAGFNASGSAQTTLYAFNANRKVWETKAPMPQTALLPAGAASGGQLYVFGSHNSGDTLFEYDPVTNSWTTIYPGTRPPGRRGAAAAGTPSYFYILGGRDAGGAILRDCWRYGGGTWTKMADMPSPRYTHAAYTTVGDSVIYVVGGNSTGVGGEADSIVYKYVIATDTWTTEIPMLTARGFLTLDRSGNKIYAICGLKGSTMFSTNEEGEPKGILPKVFSTSPFSNANGVSETTRINIVFDTDMNGSTINDTTFLVFGTQRGRMRGTITYNPPSKTATFIPDSAYHYGEVVNVILTSRIKSIGDVVLESYAFSFTIDCPSGAISFLPPVFYTSGANTRALYCADFDRDRDIDIATVNLVANTMTIFLNNGSGVFNLDSIYTVGQPNAIYGGDFNRDFRLDLAVIDGITEEIVIYSGTGNGKFIESNRYGQPAFPSGIYSNDFNNDGKFDLAILAGRSLRVYTGRGNGQFDFAKSYSFPYTGRALWGGEFNKDGKIDLCLTQADPGLPRASVFLGRGNADFQSPKDYDPGRMPFSIYAAEFNNDSLLDFAVANAGPDSVTVFLASDTMGNHTLFFRQFEPGQPYSIFSSDFNGDDQLDLSCGDLTGNCAAILVGNGNGTFQPPVDFPCGDGPRAVASADFDGDGAIDIAVCDASQGVVAILRNFFDNIAPGPPQNLTANGSNPSPWTMNPLFLVNWINPPDSSGIARAYYKLNTPPQSNFDTTGSLRGAPPDTLRITQLGGQMLYIWLKDGVGNLNYQNNASVNLRYDTIRPANSRALSQPYSTSLIFNVNWSRGSDGGGAGIRGWDVRVRRGNGGWITWLNNHSDTTEPFSAPDTGIFYFESGARDSAGNLESFKSIAECSTIVDTVKPYVFARNPVNGDTGVTPNANIYITYSEQMDSLSFDTTKFVIFGGRSGRHSFSVSYNSASYQVTLDPQNDFAFSETVFVTAKKEVRDLAGNQMINDDAWVFRTGSSVDTLPPLTYGSFAFPNPTEPISYLTVAGIVSDVGRGGSNISAAEFFIDDSTSFRYQMQPVNPPFDSSREAVYRILDTRVLRLVPGINHKIFVHGKDISRWGTYDTFTLRVIQDNDTVPPKFYDFKPDTVPDTIPFRISCRISDSSGVYDDSTGSEGQGIYLIWDNDGELINDSFELQMSRVTGDVYMTDSLINAQTPQANFVYKIYAWDNDTMPGRHPADRKKGTSGIKRIIFTDSRGPKALNGTVTPNPTRGETLIVVTAVVSDSFLGNSLIDTARYLIDGGSQRRLMKPTDGQYDEIIENVIDTLNIKAWQPGDTHRIYIQGRDIARHWGKFDSVMILVTRSPDTIPPIIISTSPSNGDTGIIRNSNVSITFSEKMDTTSLNNTTLSIRGHINGYYTFVPTYNGSQTTVTMDPDTLFAAQETVKILISSMVRDSTGNPMANPDSFYFVTGSGIDLQGPVVKYKDIYPNPTQGARYMLCNAVVSDSTTGMTTIAGAECFIDIIGPPDSGLAMLPFDGIYDEVEESVYVRIWAKDSIAVGSHKFFIHSKDHANNWGNFDSLNFAVSPDDDTLGPVFYSFSPDSTPDTADFYIYCKLTDPSGVFDDTTGSNGQGVYLVWNQAFESFSASEGYELQMSCILPADSLYRTDEKISQQVTGVSINYKVHAYDNDFDFGETWDRTRDSSQMRTIIVFDSRGPISYQTTTNPQRPPQGTRYLEVKSVVSDSTTGMSKISGAECHIDSTTGIGRAMRAEDGLFDSILERVIDTLDVSGWVAGDTHWVYVRGRDSLFNRGAFDSTVVFVDPAPDTTPPHVSVTRPAMGDTGVPLNTRINATFSERINRTTLTRDKLWVEGARSGGHDFFWTYNEADTTLTIRVYVNFAQRESAWVIISRGIRDMKGNEDTLGYWWWFKTGDAPDTLGPVVSNIRITPDTVRRISYARLDCHLQDNRIVSGGEYFIDRVGPPDSGKALKPLDGMWDQPDEDAFDDSVYVATLSHGLHKIYVRGKDDANNWGNIDSNFFYVDTSSLQITIVVDPWAVGLGKNVEIRATPNMALAETPQCTVITSKGRRTVVQMIYDTLDFYKGIYSTVGNDIGQSRVTVVGTNLFMETSQTDTSFQITAEGEFLPDDSIYVFPNPAPTAKYRTHIFFRFFVNQNALITVEIFTITGKKIYELKRNGEGGRNNNIGYSIGHFGSDVYLYRLTAQSKEDLNLTVKSPIKKFAIAK